MRRKDYYLILGISPTDAPDAIRNAYRDLAHRYHPDRTGPGGTRHFQEINEAYEVLSDPEQRAAYDRETDRISVEPTGRPTPVTVHRTRTGPIPEPMIPEPMIPDDISVLHDHFSRRSTRYSIQNLVLSLLVRINRR